MKSKIHSFVLLIFAGCGILLIPLFLANDNPIEVTMPSISKQEMEKKAEQEKQAAKAASVKAKTRRMYSCQVNEDCIIVDKDPCGCLVGPSGVVAINASYTLDFNRTQASQVTKACPDTEPSQERECSATAEAVCLKNVCKIVY